MSRTLLYEPPHRHPAWDLSPFRQLVWSSVGLLLDKEASDLFVVKGSSPQMNHRTAILLRRHSLLKHPEAKPFRYRPGTLAQHPRKRAARRHRKAWQATPWNERHELRKQLQAELEEVA